MTDNDFGQHLATGRWIVAHLAVPQTDPFSWTYSTHPYVAYHWLFQVLLYGADAVGGIPGVVVLRSVLLLLTIGLLADTLRLRGVPALAAGACSLVALVAIEWRFALRPELFSLLGLAATAWILQRRRPLWALAVIQLVWVSTHIFALGWVLILAAALQDAVAGKLDRRWRIALGLSAAAVFLNPYGWRAVVLPLLLGTRMSGDNLFAQQISELASPFALGSDPRFPWGLSVQLGCWKVLLLGGLAAIPGLLRRRRLDEVAVLIVFGVLSAQAVRNIPLYAVVALPAVAEAVGRIPLRRARRGLHLAVAVVALVTALRVADGAWYAGGRRPVRMAATVPRTELAVEMADFLDRNGLSERGFNNLDVGGALLWRHPSGRVFIDGRNEVSGEAFFRKYLELNSPQGWDRRSPAWRFEYVALGHAQAGPLVRKLLADPGWRPVHLDAVGIVFARVDGLYDALPPVRMPPPVGEGERRELLAAIQISPGSLARASRWLLGTEEAPGEEHLLGTFLLMAGQWDAAERSLLEAARRSPNHWETSNNLGALYWRQRRWRQAAVCYRRVLEMEPGNVMATERAQAAEARGR